jgi:membrane-associated phospholipid phosphatase
VAAGTRPLAWIARVVVSVALLWGLLAGFGLLITKVWQHDYPFDAEDGVDRTLAAHRTGFGKAVIGFFSMVGSTGIIIAVLIVVAICFRLAFHRWRESLFLVLAVSTQALVFLLTTLTVSRPRPQVPKLDVSPPTTSYPSGHTGAATALYVGIALVLAWHLGHSRLRWPLITLLVLVPLCVATSRLYRGMHHPSDVLTALVNGAACILLYARAVLFGVLPDSWARRLDGSSVEHADPGSGRATESRTPLRARPGSSFRTERG